MTRTEALYYKIFENEGTVGIVEHIYEWRMKHVEEMLKLFRETIDTLKLKWLCHKNNICWGCFANKTEDIAEFLETRTIPVYTEFSGTYPKYKSFDNFGFDCRKIEGKNLGATEGLCNYCFRQVIDLDGPGDPFCSMVCHMERLRLQNIILQPKHFMLIGIVFKYMVVRGSLGKNYYDDTMEFNIEVNR